VGDNGSKLTRPWTARKKVWNQYDTSQLLSSIKNNFAETVYNVQIIFHKNTLEKGAIS
jgi:high-affinity Fe2+/Pb2+ permease